MCTKQVTHTCTVQNQQYLHSTHVRTHTHTQDYDAATKTLETPDDETQTDEQCRKSRNSQLVWGHACIFTHEAVHQKPVGEDETPQYYIFIDIYNS